MVYRDGLEVASKSAQPAASGNGEMEVVALFNALDWLKAEEIEEPVVIWCDSRYVIDGCNRLLKIWRTNGWKRITANPRERKRPIPDQETWRAVDSLLSALPSTEVQWCMGHSGNTGNEQADKLASIQSRKAGNGKSR